MRSYLKGFIAAVILSSLAACMTVPVSGRKAFNIVPESMEMSMGAQSYDAMMSKEKISQDKRLNDIVTRVGKRIAAVANRPDYKWEFKVIDSDVQNAFCMPGGKIAAYRGILPVTKNEAGLATVLAHEVTHAIARHGGQRISLTLGLAGGTIALSQTVLKNNSNATYIMAALGLGSAVGVVLPYSRFQESEADEVGQTLMARAGYDPTESVNFWHRFAEVTKGNSMPTLLSDHPSSSGREEDMRNRLPAAQQEYAQAPNHYGLGESF